MSLAAVHHQGVTVVPLLKFWRLDIQSLTGGRGHSSPPGNAQAGDVLFCKNDHVLLRSCEAWPRHRESKLPLMSPNVKLLL